MDTDAVLETYRRYAPRYDFYFGAVFQPGRRSLIARMNCGPGERVLEVGVGTGLSLPVYPRDVEVTGIDLSQAMLARARARRVRHRLANVSALRCMDAQAMQFADDSFDKVVAMYVVSVAPDPVRLLDEMRRVCKPDGELYLVNHFHRTRGLVGAFERLGAPLSRQLGFRPDFSLERLVREAHLEVVEQTPVNLFGYWTLLRLRNNKRRGGSGGVAH
jgi:phosphatidylethanolamine/phosphatidyl-N-methylethanolamine N-methyltransferase